MLCINKKSKEFQTIVKQSGLPEDFIAAICGSFVEQHGRFPKLDEIPYADSTSYIENLLKVKNQAVNIDYLLQITNTQSINEAVVQLNTIYSDLQIELTPIGKTAKITITKRPITKPIEQDKITPNALISNYALFGNIVTSLQKLYGINIKQIDLDTIQEQFPNIPGLTTAKAFVLNGDIYINTELADKDAPIHEMMHILVGELKTNNSKLYYSLVDFVSNLDEFKAFSQQFVNRTQSDLAEEMFVEEVSKLMVGMKSSLPNEVIYELMYTTKRILDSILMGECSVKDYNNIFNKSLIQLGTMVNSQLFDTKIPVNRQHRIIQNKKKELLENNELKEYCDA